MPRLKITRLEVVSSAGRKLGCDLSFKDGINIIRGENRN
jgi:hypothetical protein